MKLNSLLMGALTSKVNKYNYRFWESKSIEIVDLFDSSIVKIKIVLKGSKIIKIVPNLNKDFNQDWVSDKLRFSFDSFYNQRLESPLIFINNRYLKISWINVIKKFKFDYFFIHIFSLDSNINLIENKYKSLTDFLGIFFLLGDNIDRNFLISLKNFKNNINNPSVFFYTKYNNFIFSNKNSIFKKYYVLRKSLDIFKNIDSVFFLNVNLRLENPILNIYLNKLKNKISFFSFGFLPNFSFDIKILSNNVNSFIKFIEVNSIFNFKINNIKKILFLLSSSLLYQSNGYRFLSIFRNNSNFFFINQNNLDINFMDLGFLSSESLHIQNTYNNEFLEKNIKPYFNINFFIGTFKLKIQELNFKTYKSLLLQGINIYQGFYFNFDNKYDLLIPSKSLYESKDFTFLDFFGNFKIFNCLNFNFKNSLSNINIFWLLNFKFLKYNNSNLINLDNYLMNFSFSNFSIKISNNKFKFNKVLFNTNLKLFFLNSFVLNSKKIKEIISNFIFINFNFSKIKNINNLDLLFSKNKNEEDFFCFFDMKINY